MWRIFIVAIMVALSAISGSAAESSSSTTRPRFTNVPKPDVPPVNAHRTLDPYLRARATGGRQLTNWVAFRESVRMGADWVRVDRDLRASALVSDSGELVDFPCCAIP